MSAQDEAPSAYIFLPSSFPLPFLIHWPITAKFYRLVEVSRIAVLTQMSFFLWALKNLPRAQPCNTVPAVGRVLLEACAVRYHWAGVADSLETTSLVPGLKELHVLYQLAAIPVFVAWLTLGLCLCAVLCSVRTSCWRLDWKPVNLKAGISEGPPGYMWAVSVSFRQINLSVVLTV